MPGDPTGPPRMPRKPGAHARLPPAPAVRQTASPHTLGAMAEPHDTQGAPRRSYPVHWEADVVLRDGGIAHIRPIGPDDAGRLVDFYERVSDESKYYRFFAPYPKLSDRDVHRFTHHDYDDRVGLAATIGGEFIATVRYDRTDELGRAASGTGTTAEVAFLVQDAHQGRGVASALLEHIAAVARERGIAHFTADVLPANSKMVKVFTDAGYTQRRSFADGVVHLALDLEPTAQSVQVMRSREHRAEARSMQRLLRPESVAVIGTGRRPGGVGRTVLRNILAGGFTGRVHAVNRAFPPGGTEIDGVPGVRSVREVAARGEHVDLAVVAVPADQVPHAVADCGEAGVRGLLVVTAGYSESGPEGRQRQRELVRMARGHGMRLIGPNAFGLVNTAPSVRLNASLSTGMPHQGRLGLFTQSGSIGIALLTGLHRRGTGPATFVSAGNRADVSGNDLLQFWQEDPDTDAVLMYLESFGNPRKFTRLARRTAAVKPVVVVKGALHSGSVPAGHTVPVARIPDSTVNALFRQAGVIRVDTVTELMDAGLFLALQPLPAGDRLAILGNSESLGLLTYDAALTAGLRPSAPLDLTTSAAPADFAAALTRALADPDTDAVVVTAIPRVSPDDPDDPRDPDDPDAPEPGGPEDAPGQEEAPGHSAVPDGDDPELAAALREAAAGGKPVLVVHLALDAFAERLGAAAGPGARVPAYRAPERAVHSLGEAVRYAAWRAGAAEPGKVPQYEDVQEAAAARDVRRLLRLGGDRPVRRGLRRAARPLRHRGPPRPARTGRGRRGGRRPGAGLPGRPQDRRPAPAAPRRPRRRPARPRRRGRPAAGVRRTRRAARRPGGTAPRRPGDGAPRRRHRGTRRGRPGRRRRALLRARRAALGTARRPRAPAGPGHRPGRRRTGPLHQGGAHALRLARRRARRHRGAGGTAAAGVAARRRPPGGRRSGPRPGGGGPARCQRALRERPPGAAARPQRPRPARPRVVLTRPAARRSDRRTDPARGARTPSAPGGRSRARP